MRTIKNYLEYFALLLIKFVIRFVPLRLSLAIGAWISSLGFSLFRIRRKVTLDQLNAAFPEKSDSEIKHIARESYRNLGRIAIEMIKLPYLNKADLEKMITFKGAQHFDEGLAQGKGLILIACHLGNWEMAGAYIASHGYPLSSIVNRQHNLLMDRFINNVRQEKGMKIIYKREAAKKVARAIRNNRIAGFLSDQDARDDGVFVPFFGRLASTPRGAAFFHVRVGAPAVMIFIFRTATVKHQCIVEPLDIELTGDLETDVYNFTAKYVARLEQYIRKYPDQWLWQHRRWKTKVKESELKIVGPTTP